MPIKFLALRYVIVQVGGSVLAAITRSLIQSTVLMKGVSHCPSGQTATHPPQDRRDVGSPLHISGGQPSIVVDSDVSSRCTSGTAFLGDIIQLLWKPL